MFSFGHDKIIPSYCARYIHNKANRKVSSVESNILVAVGTYTHPIQFGTGQVLEGKGKGIYLYRLSLESGTLAHMYTATDAVNPSYLVLNQNNQCLYAVNELKKFNGMASGAVSAYAFSAVNWKLQYLNCRPTHGTDPCHVTINTAGTHVYVSNFMSGSVSVFPLESDGRLKPASQFIQHQGHSVNPERQSGPHAHALIFSPDKQYALVPDLGLDKLMLYKVVGHSLDEPNAVYYKASPGSGPRYCTFGLSGKHCYLINEMSASIDVLSFSPAEASFTALQRISTLPKNASASHNNCADMHITPNGKYLYASNRGHNSLAVYQIDQESGLLSYIDSVSCSGKIPRSFNIDPTGRFLLCANQDSDNMVVFEINSETGLLKQKTEVNVNTPVCVKSYLV